ncbi:hypothetical protein DSO57_1014189 [Entomophthora muscae]|uniref:Uncharacterized protein n=1 Tax=Entomophthora muscae TaxID=34485 RepID=A0ACC2T5P5_9FUNG|nr:hypothetical protein DSO57_1014189 [Entomophthora muscae]
MSNTAEISKPVAKESAHPAKKREKRKAKQEKNKTAPSTTDTKSAKKDSTSEAGKTGKSTTDSNKPKKKKLNKTEKKEKLVKVSEENVEQKIRDANNYLTLFVSEKSSWKFKKLTQIFIFQNLYSDKFDESSFEKILLYLKDCKGQARTALLEEARKIYESESEERPATPETEEKQAPEEEESTDMKFKKDRAHRILSTLS